MRHAVRVRGGGLVNPRAGASLLAQQAGQSGAGGATSPVSAVNGRTGVVTLTAADFAAGTFPGDVVFTSGSTGTTQTAGNSTTRIATTAFATTADNLKANLASPTFTGTVTVPNGSSATNIAAFGQIPTVGSVGGLSKIVARTSDSATRSVATLSDDDQLVLAVGANDRWFIEGFLTFTAVDGAGSASTADIHTGWSVPASGTMVHGNGMSASATTSGFALQLTGGTPTALKAAGTGASATGAAAVTFGLLVAAFYTGGGTAGNVTLQWAQNSTNSATLQLNKNSVLVCARLA